MYDYSVWLVDWLVGLFPPLFETHVCLFLGAGLFFGWTTCCLVRWCADLSSRWMKVYPPFGVSSLGQVQLLVGLVDSLVLFVIQLWVHYSIFMCSWGI